MMMSVFNWNFIYHEMKDKVLQHEVVTYIMKIGPPGGGGGGKGEPKITKQNFLTISLI
jgi:hypothetical protein